VIGLLPDAVELQAASDRLGVRWESLRQSVGGHVHIWHAHLHDTYDRRILAALALRRLVGPSVVTEHLPRSPASDPSLEPHFRRSPGARQAKTAFKRVQVALADRTIAVSESSGRFLRTRYGLSGRSLRVVVNGVPPVQRVHGPALAGTTVELVSVGALIRQKGPDVAFEAMRLARADVRLTFLGDGKERRSLERRAAELPAGRVRFAGWSDDVEGALERSDVLCMASRWESCPYAAIEAMMVGLPVVASAVDGLDEMVEHGESGLLVPPDDPRALAAALDELAERRHALAAMGQAAHARAASRYSLERMLEWTLDVYREAGPRRQRLRRPSTRAR
jgi:glycosyltransferase involved in cell wall biosynthesis